MTGEGTLTLDVLVRNLWDRGIPVIPLEFLPTPGFQALACQTSGRPVILLGHKYDAPGRVAFMIAHEAGHIAHGDCHPDAPVVDEEDEIADESPMELSAERYATTALVGNEAAPRLATDTPQDAKTLARQALELERSTGAEASTIIFGWARQTLDYGTATMAVRALYRASGARRRLSELSMQHIDLKRSSETDRDLLRCILGLASDDDPSD
jgi:hypothetical protein